MERDENPESVKQWDAGFKSCVAISKVFFILDAALTISEEYPALSLRTILKQVCACIVWGSWKFPTYKPLPSEDGDGVALMSVVESPCLLVNVSRCVEEYRDSDHTEVLS